MKHRKSTRVLSFYLAILAAVMLLSFGTLSVYAAENEPPTDDIPTDETVIDSQSTADQSEYEESAEVAADETEMETEVLYYEYEIENTAMTAPPMTDIGGSVDPDGLELETGFLQSGVYAIENVGNDNYYMSVESGSVDSGFRVVQQNYGSNTPLTNFSRASLFKVTRIDETNRYIIRAMTNNRLSICPDTDINEDEMITSFINTDDANALGCTYTIVMAGSLCTIKPYGSSEVIAAPNSTASGDTNADAAQLILTTQTAAGTRGKWRFTKYTGNEKYGYHIYRTAGMGDGLVKGNTGTIWLKTWSTVINANTPYLAIKSPYSSVATADWQANNYLATITAHKCGDYQMEIQTRLGSSSTVRHTQSTTYTVIPDIVGDTTFVQNVATGKYMEVESASEANGGIVQQWTFHTGEQAKWIFELDGNGYFKIKNVNSGKYLGANSSNVSEVRQYDTVTDYSRWKIVETSTGNYRLICKASTWRYSVLATPTTTDGDGVNLTVQTTYTDDTSYNDEWKIKTLLPTSGSEVEYDTLLWNYLPVIDETNCYAYSLNNQVFPGTNILWYMQPGQISGLTLSSENLTGKTVENFVKEDASTLGFIFTPISKGDQCSSGTYKVALVISQSPHKDYHWYRQNPDGTWSHKPGPDAVTNTDASGNIILDPEFADRNYWYANYSTFVGFYEVTPLNNMYSSSRAVDKYSTNDNSDMVWLDSNKNDLPSYQNALSICEGMRYSEVANYIGHPQRIVTFGLLVVEYELDDGNSIFIEYVEGDEGGYVVEHIEFLLSEE